ncbi:MAG: hypothetical protein NZM43_01380 [Saprospiraceae bacterium]|nr:hypothetical protein [Saprospiraceae bacterium]MDW8482952.1 hypothetical protein [Saprospiraceae bacterium]
MYKQLSLGLPLGIIALFLGGCASLTGFHDGRTVGKEQGDFYMSLNFSSSPNFREFDRDSLNANFPTLSFPNLEFGGRYGVGEKVDITLRLNTNLNMGLGAKFQLIGDAQSPFAMALGTELGSFGIILGLLNLQVPLYLSVHPSEVFAWYLTPRYIRQFTTYSSLENALSYYGGNTGILIGKRHKFGVDIGYYRVGGIDSPISLTQFGLGGRFAFGKK